MLDEAKRNVEEQFSVVGLTERFDESVVLLGQAFGWQNLVYEPVNVWESPPPAELPPETLRRIEDENWLDRELYEFAKQRFARLVEGQGDDFAITLEALRRSRELREGTAPPVDQDLRSQLVDARAQLFLARLELAEASEPQARAGKAKKKRKHRRGGARPRTQV
jgi:hypothetical protein